MIDLDVLDRDRFIGDTSRGDVGPTSCPVPPANWGAGRMVRVDKHRGWAFVAADADQPFPSSTRPIMTGEWRDSRVNRYSARVSGRLQLNIEDGGPPVISLRLGLCPAWHWNEAVDKNSPGELILDKEQAEYLRDALSAMIARMA